MPVCGEPHPEKSGIFCISEVTVPHDHIHPATGIWLSDTLQAQEAEREQQRTSGKSSRRKVMIEAARRAKPDVKVGPYEFPMARTDDPPNAHEAAARIEPKRGTRQSEVLHYLRDRAGQWVNGLDLATERVGGAQGLKRVRELRQAGWDIELRPDPESNTTWQYRLHLPAELPG